MKPKFKQHLLHIVSLIVILSVFFFKLLFQRDYIFLIQDAITIDYPAAWYYGKYLKNFSFPLWIKENLCGYPQVFNGYFGFFYPINLLIFFLFPGIKAMNISVVLRFFLLGLTIYD
jgi:hypothetical protein